MINNKKELDFYLQADMMMNRGCFKKSFVRKLYEIWIPDKVMQYLRAMRYYSYYAPPQKKRRIKEDIIFTPNDLLQT